MEKSKKGKKGDKKKAQYLYLDDVYVDEFTIGEGDQKKSSFYLVQLKKNRYSQE